MVVILVWSACMYACVLLPGFEQDQTSTYQSLHSAVQGVSVVPAELGVDTLQRGVTVRLRPLDTVAQIRESVCLYFTTRPSHNLANRINSNCRRGLASDAPVPVILAVPVVLRRVLRLCKTRKKVSALSKYQQSNPHHSKKNSCG